MVPRPVLLGGALVILALVLVYVLMSDKDSEQVADAPDPPVTEAPGSSAAKAPDSPAAGATPQQSPTSTGGTAGAAPTTAEEPDSTVAKAPDSPVAGVTPQQSPASTGGTTGAAPTTPEAPDSTVAGAAPRQSPTSTDGTTRDAPAASDAAAPVQTAGVSAADRSADGQPAEPETAAAPLPDRDQAAQDQAAQDQAARDQAAVDDAARGAASGTPAQDTGADSRTPAQTTSATPQTGDRPASSGVVLPVVRSAASDPASSGPEKPRSSGDTETAAAPAATASPDVASPDPAATPASADPENKVATDVATRTEQTRAPDAAGAVATQEAATREGAAPGRGAADSQVAAAPDPAAGTSAAEDSGDATGSSGVPGGRRTADGKDAPASAERREQAAAPATGDSEQAGKDAGPEIDIVRVSPEGDTLIAGRAKPDSVIEVGDGKEIVGSTRSDPNGDFVVATKPLQPGDTIVTLRQTGKDGSQTESRDAIIVGIAPPETKDSGTDRTPLVVVVPRDSNPALGRPTRVVQAPEPTEEPAAPPAGSEAQVVKLFPEPSGTAGQTGEGEPEQRVTINTVDYDDSGRIILGGQAEPDTPVQIYVDNKLSGTSTANGQGQWVHQSDRAIEPGPHELRVDQVTETGKVLARAVLPFVRARPFRALPGQTVVVIQPGNNLWTIAYRVYGSGTRYTTIYQANSDQIRDPDLIYPGQVFGLPKARL